MKFFDWFRGIWCTFANYFSLYTPVDYKPEELRDTRRICIPMFWINIFGLVCLGLVCWSQAPMGILWALSCLSVGFIVGLLFGIPKVKQRNQKSDRSTYYQKVNTSISEISDWLTKIIVGLGLYQLEKVPEWINRLAKLFASSVGRNDQERGVFGAAIVFFLVCGFLFGYLITRTYLQRALARAERSDDSDGLSDSIPTNPEGSDGPSSKDASQTGGDTREL